ncbi:MAG: hypothetical protein JEY71_03785 [Sphaerochaeta sp.]|nr:hypothetical protein [Sphaerochaeta sp.]
MKRSNVPLQDDMRLTTLLGLIGIPTILTTTAYVLVGQLQIGIPSILLFFLLTTVILFPLELAVVLFASKRSYGSFSLKSAFANHKKMSWPKLLLFGVVLFGFAGLMSAVITPIERMLTEPLASRLFQSIPVYFDSPTKRE